jgi:holliday junction DNA helicase RuvA
MIGYLSGTIQTISNNYVIIDVNGVGYRVVLPEKMHSSISQAGDAIKVFTHFNLNPRDGSVELFGFATPEELKFFELLTTVSGVGPKSAQSILSKADLQTLQLGIMKGDDKYLSQVAGIGPKTAQRLIVELKEKIMKADVGSRAGVDMESETEALDALKALGYSQYQAIEALKQVSKDIKTTEDKITEALKNLAKP